MTTDKWTTDHAEKSIYNYSNFSDSDKENILEKMNKSFSPSRYQQDLEKLNQAIKNNLKQSTILDEGTQHYPETLNQNNIDISQASLNKFAIVLMAGGEGERLRLSLLDNGYNEEDLKDFTKATFPLPEFPKGFGALQINLLVISDLCKKYKTDIPVVITTGPKGSTTEILIPKIISEANNFGLKNIKIVPQNERLHLTEDKKVAINKDLKISTNPDETGGPIMKLKEVDCNGNSIVSWLDNLHKEKIIVLQATALYNPELIEIMAGSANKFDGLGVGIEREIFPPEDPFGTFVLIEESKNKSLKIIEKAVRNDKTRELTNSNGKFLPFNTGFYIFNVEILKNCDLPDYCTPPKEVLPGIPSAPKAGYAATDIIAFAEKPAVLTISTDSFAVIKDASDPAKLSTLGKKYKLDILCKNYVNELSK